MCGCTAGDEEVLLGLGVLCECRTFEVEVFGPVDILGDWLCVHLERVCVGSISRDDHIMPLVIVQWVVTVPLQQTWPVPQVKHIVDEPGREEAQQMNTSGFVCLSVYICECVFVFAIYLFFFPGWLIFKEKSPHAALTLMGVTLIKKTIFSATQCRCFYKLT